MNISKKVFFFYFILHLTLLLVDSFEEYEGYEKRAKYDSNAPNENKTCSIPWETSILSEPYPSCWIMCKSRCIILSRTTQWRCKVSKSRLFENCHCCNEDY